MSEQYASTGIGALVRQYVPDEGHWDEALLASGFPRRHWRELSVGLGRMGFKQLSRRWEVGQQLIQANGVTYNIYGDPKGKERPWLLDPIPLLISESEWAHIESSIIQRATLLNAIAADIYGEQKLLKEKKIPPALIYGSSNFLRPCVGLKQAGNVYLHSYAADLARSPDGQWWVISDRTQAPSGVGYALENRLVSARTLPSIFNLHSVRQLRSFFEMQREGLLKLAPQSAINARRNPRVVLLTPGPHNETYFEHSFLARQWGFPVVEGADLIARDDQVFLKTLSGLEPVDLILRRVDDEFCDPLELRGDSLLGVPGLLRAVRAGNVVVANALGSGLLETPCLMPFLPGLSREILGEEQRMPSVATWWCGQEAERRYVLDHLTEVVIKPAFPRFGQSVEFPVKMNRAARAALVKRIEANPEQYVAQEQVKLSTAPVRTEYGIAPRHVVLRVFAAWNGEGYSVMPGGLTRVSTADKSLVVSMQLGGGSKDTWVLGKDPAPLEGVAEAAAVAIDAPRGTGELPSRAADNLFWLGRYAERVEANVRLVRTLMPGLSGEGDFGRSASLDTMVRILSNMGYLPEETPQTQLGQQLWRVQRILTGMVWDPPRSAGIGWNLKQIRRVAWPLKERLSPDTWRVLQELDALFNGIAPQHADLTFVAEINLLDRAVLTLSAFAGLLSENTTRGYGWRFLEIGRRLERAIQMAEMLDATIARMSTEGDAETESHLDVLLQIADSTITYRNRWLTTLRVDNVLGLLLADEANPRSIAFQLVMLLENIQHLPGRKSDDTSSPEYKLISKALALVRQAWMEDLARPGKNGEFTALGELLLQLRGTIYDFSDALSARYFSHLTQSSLRA